MQVDINLLPRQAEILYDDHRFKVMVCGRRFGKTEYCSIEHLFIALTGAPRRVQWMIAPTFTISKIMWRKLKSIIRQYNLGEYVTDIKEGELYIEFVNGTTIWCKSADKPENLVGEGLAHVSLDEYGVMKPDVWYESIRPALLDTGGSATFIGTPKGKNHFYDVYKAEGENWTSFRYSSYENPLIDPEELEDIVKDMPEFLYRQEILAEFLDEGGEVFRTYKSQITNLQPISNEGDLIIYGIDLGKINDFTVIVGYDSITRRPVSYERFNKIDWEYQISKIIEHVSKTPNHIVFIDSSGVGEPLYDYLKKSSLTVRAVTISSGKNVNMKIDGGVKYTVPKHILIQRLAVALETQNIYLPDDKYVNDEFDQYEYNITQSGTVTYSAPPGKNDDTVMAISLANFGLSVGGNCIGGLISDLEIVDSSAKTNYDFEPICDYEEDVLEWDDFGNI